MYLLPEIDDIDRHAPGAVGRSTRNGIPWRDRVSDKGIDVERHVDCKTPALPRGTVFRSKGRHPYEAWVDFMLVLDDARDNPLVLVVATGYGAGHVVVSLPREGIHEGTVMLSTAWLLENWSKWVYAECAVEDVYYLEKYTVPRAEQAS